MSFIIKVFGGFFGLKFAVCQWDYVISVLSNGQLCKEQYKRVDIN